MCDYYNYVILRSLSYGAVEAENIARRNRGKCEESPPAPVCLTICVAARKPKRPTRPGRCFRGTCFIPALLCAAAGGSRSAACRGGPEGLALRRYQPPRTRYKVGHNRPGHGPGVGPNEERRRFPRSADHWPATKKRRAMPAPARYMTYVSDCIQNLAGKFAQYAQLCGLYISVMMVLQNGQL